ncbi:hypothetical protein ABH966_000417 [Lysinibacillus sp. RC46]
MNATSCGNLSVRKRSGSNNTRLSDQRHVVAAAAPLSRKKIFTDLSTKSIPDAFIRGIIDTITSH